MKKAFVLVLTLMLILACGTASATRVIQLGQIDANIMEDPYYLYAYRFGEKLAELSNGEFEIDIIGDAQLGGEAAMLEGMSIETIDAAIISNFTFSSFVPEFCTLDMPYLFDTKEEVYAVVDNEEIMGALKDALYEQHSAKILHYADGGFRSIISANKAINTPDDFKGFKIRVPGNDTYLKAFEALGASPITMASSECIPGLQQGTIDAMEQPICPMYSYGAYEICKYIVMTEHIFNPITITVSRGLWESLNEEEQGWFMQAAEEAANEQRAEIDSLEGVLLQRMQDNSNATVIIPESKDAFRAACEAAYESYYATYGHDLMDAVDAAIQSVSAQ